MYIYIYITLHARNIPYHSITSLVATCSYLSPWPGPRSRVHSPAPCQDVGVAGRHAGEWQDGLQITQLDLARYPLQRHHAGSIFCINHPENTPWRVQWLPLESSISRGKLQLPCLSTGDSLDNYGGYKLGICTKMVVYQQQWWFSHQTCGFIQEKVQRGAP